jgi:isoleucyl-tRNA synthetase
MAGIRDGSGVGVNVGGHDHSLSAEDLLFTMQPPDGFSVEREGTHAVALDLSIDDDLKREGLSRDIVHAIQNARRNAGLAVEDRIELRLDGDDSLLQAARAHDDYVRGETLTVEVHLGAGNGTTGATTHSEQATINGLTLQIALCRVSGAAGSPS